MIEKFADTDDKAAEILALGRMVSYARQQAQAMDLEFSTYCLDVALRSIVQDIAKKGFCFAANENMVSLSNERN
ncbi:hypothetical protein [Neorhizobium sp. NCHU2750]|uniref:hypothetical protein n=1 Tax=Neorhizobium sp. NCHU2750 TaxID=1825976 RepID=UPI000E7687EF|nr:hypothetical protein NCHU2750_50180 [Neorhizobium sp. NCHU2750]